MPIIDLTCTVPIAVSGMLNTIGPTDANFTHAVHAEGSGDWIYNPSGFGASLTCTFGPAPISPGSTINSVSVVASCRGTAAGSPSPPAPYVAALVLIGLAHGFNTGAFPITGSFAEYVFLYPHSCTIAELFNLIQIGLDAVGGDVECEYLAVRVDYTPPPPPGRIATWVAPAWPPTCGVPPLRRFKPFELIDRGAASPEEVTALYAAKFGQPPSGYYLWVVWRSMDHDFWPNEQSPIEGYIVP